MRFVKTAENLFGLPQGFTRVEYLESTGTQYIDTGVYRTDNGLITGNNLTSFGFKGVIEYTSMGARRLMGDSGANNGFWGIAANNKFETGTTSTYTASANTKYKIDYFVTATDMTLVVNLMDGTEAVNFSRTAAVPTKITSATFDIFALGGNFINSGTRVYKYQVLVNGNLLRDFIPCVDPLGVPCMYDLVGKKPYYNQGTGTFTAGRQVVPVEYLESTTNVTSSGPYIDTGIEALNTTSFMIDFSFKNTAYGQGMGEGYLAGKRFSVVGFYINGGSTYFGYAYNSWYDTDVAVDTNRHTFELDAYNKKYYLDNYTYNIPNVSYTSEGKTIGLFCRICNNNGTTYPNWFCAGKMYGARIKQNGTLVRDFIPCKDENNVGFMFDTLSGTVYLNAGTGAFVIGNNKYKTRLRLIKDNKLPAGYTQVEYIESENIGGTVVQYAVGNYRLTNTTDWEITFSAESTGNNWILGQPTWIGVHYRKDTSTSNLPRVGITNSAAAVNQCYVDYTNNEKITLALKGSDVYANGVKVGSITRISAPAAQTKYGIFAYKDINQELPNLRIQSARIYRLKIWDNGVLVQDLIPAMKNGVAGFYERVNKTFIEKESNSTSDFTTGKPVLPIVRFIKDILPAGYKAVNYLESSGTQYIDTGFKPNPATTKIDCAFCGFSGGSTQMFGARTVASSNNENNTNICFGPLGSKIYIRGDWIRQNNNLVTDIEPEEYIHLIAHNQTVSINGTEYSSTLEKNNAYLDYNFCLFACNTAGTIQFYSKIRQYNFKIYDNNTIVRNFIPVVRLLDNKAGMWDTVTKQFYTTPVGNFITG